eukprot:SAG11_NODE_23809_length_382_cov_6.318021_1_plen_99_part_01
MESSQAGKASRTTRGLWSDTIRFMVTQILESKTAFFFLFFAHTVPKSRPGGEGTGDKTSTRQNMVHALALRAIASGSNQAIADMACDALCNFSALRIGH